MSLNPSVTGCNPNYCPGWRGLKFLMGSNLFTIYTALMVAAHEVLKVHPYIAPKPALKG